MPRWYKNRKHLFVTTTNYDTNPESVLPFKIFDSHCHLDRIFLDRVKRAKIGLEGFDKKAGPPTESCLQILTEKYPEVFGKNFAGCISNCCDPENWQYSEWYFHLGRQPGVHLTFGCHPAKADMWNEEVKARLVTFLDSKLVKAVGEMGLDSTYYDRVPKDVQVKAFQEQMKIAMEACLPMVVHLRGQSETFKDGHGLMLKVLGDKRLTTNIHMHCCSFSLGIAQRFLADFPRMRFGFVPHYFEKDVAAQIPLESIIVETDAPYFIPVQFKGTKRSFNGQRVAQYPIGLPGFAYHSLAQIAQIKKLPIAEVIKANNGNILDVYGIDIEGITNQRPIQQTATQPYLAPHSLSFPLLPQVAPYNVVPPLVQTVPTVYYPAPIAWAPLLSYSTMIVPTYYTYQ